MGMLSFDDLVLEAQELLLQEVRMMIRTVGLKGNPNGIIWKIRDLAEEENDEYWNLHDLLRLSDLQLAAIKDNLKPIEEDVLSRVSSRYLRMMEPDYDYC